jgi:hypothetical protein
MNNDLDNLEKCLNRFCKSIKTKDKTRQDDSIKKFIELKNNIRQKFSNYSSDDKLRFKYICAEFKIVSNEEAINKLFERFDIEDPKVPNNNDSILKEAKEVSSTTTSNLRRSMEDLQRCREIAEEAQITIDMDNTKIQHINKHIDEIQSDAQIAGKLITRFIKRLYTDKLILMFIFIIMCLIIIIVLIKFKIIKL